MRRLFGIGCLASALAISVGFLPQPALAASRIIRIGTGTPASCTETAFINALATARARHGATIRFRCGRAPVVIPVSDALTIPTNTTIDGDGLVTLQGGDGTFAVLLVDAPTGAAFSLAEGHGGGIYNHGGELKVTNSVIEGNTAVAPGGGISTCCDGSTSVQNALVIGNLPDDVVP